MKLFIVFLITISLVVFIYPCFAVPVVKAIYFVPNDRSIQWTLPRQLDTQMKNVHTFFSEQMVAHGYADTNFTLDCKCLRTSCPAHSAGDNTTILIISPTPLTRSILN